MAIFSGKSIILAAPMQYGFSDLIERELRFQGFEVYNLSFIQHEFKYKNIAERLNCYIHKNFLGQKDYKTYLKFKRVEREMMARLADIPYVDYALVIRPDQYSKGFIDAIGCKADKIGGYQWDGLNRYPAVYQRINCFDRFFVFDPKDAKYPNRLPITNFYTHSFDVSRSSEYASDLYYIGSYIKKRTSQVEEIITTLQDRGLAVKCHIYRNRKRKAHLRHLMTSSVNMTYHENLQFVFNSRMLLDVPTEHHNGLSFRVLEAIGFNKKLITTNEEIKGYDFYHPNNIFVWDKRAHENIQAFLDAPYVELDDRIKAKYSFSRWITNMLEEHQEEQVVAQRTVQHVRLEPALVY